MRAEPLRRLVMVLVLVAAGAALKTLAAAASGSRAVLADSVTCIASVASAAALLYYYRLSLVPPDEDHPYGHLRLRYGGVLASMAFYLLAAGANMGFLVAGAGGYRVDAAAGLPWLLAGTGLYAAAVLEARGLDPVVRAYAGFTASELLETSVSLAGSAAGQLLGYVYDLAAASAITAYILYEALQAHMYLLRVFADAAAPRSLYDALRRELGLRGLELRRARLRMLDDTHCAGDAVAAPRAGMPADVADLLADEAAEEMKRMGCDVVIHVAYAERPPASPGESASAARSETTETTRL